MSDNMKIVEFDTWCPSCKYYKTKETEDPCNECLGVPANESSTKPVKYRNDSESKK